MTITSNTPASDNHFRYGNPAVVCDGASMRAHHRQLATVVTVKGVIGSENLDQISAYVRRLVIPEKSIVLDLSGVNSFAPQAVSLFYDIDARCSDEGVDWAVVASQAVTAELRDEDAGVPLTASVPDALHHFAEGTMARRRLLPLLVKSA
ncbi:STAS domain-containing protein [Mycolicibacterium goodii]|uniref:Anti-anti-sigma factor n=1 Tax=Mycolicibacterium goodii TaxID=134601 RepID=A0ABS6HU47_MYCGD|nr:STAS domain-containing protein [Mycolicibacterium goodii]MBU8818558.1 anti-anti-sigma factor [Mycolicibacterium goodii]MBU8825738.1 anti-anti-sigma factor [Mycolicibacterium goodii]MBU8829850.1 anti-anti-sigma factor [Mycolicibacterium goodii]MBU8839969.1 anti-anti-sigma factor [Mycolicibacterium goodii]ULN48350.1 anti-anti-sigma factor [Mycolicibacterium goodii]